MKKTSVRAVTCGFNRFALVALSAAAFVGIFTTMRAQGGEEEGYSATEESLSAGESSWVVFTLRGKARVTFEYKIESGKAVEIYIMTREQFDRGKAGAEPTQPGKDFIRDLKNISGHGTTIETLSPGRYAIVFRNRAGQPVRVWTHSTAVRL